MEVLSKTSGFVQRKSNLTGFLFTQALICNDKDYCTLTLNDIVEKLYITYGINTSKQGLDQRFNLQSVEYLKKVLEKELSKQLKETVPQLTGSF